MLTMKRPAYPSDLSDDEWELLKPLIPIHLINLRTLSKGTHRANQTAVRSKLPTPRLGSGAWQCPLL